MKTNFQRTVSIFVTIFLQVTLCDLSVVMDPEWVNYGQAATITLTFDPPCPTVSIYRRGLDITLPDECVFGPKCKVDPARPNMIQTSLNPNGTWLRFTAANAMANGRYYAVCPNATYDAVISIGVKPRIIAIEYGSPEYGAVVNLTRWQNGRKVPWNSPENDPNAETVFKTDYPVPMPTGDTYVTFILGMGVNPREMAPQAIAPKMFKLEVPDFDKNKEMPRERLADYCPFPDYPMATRFRYRLNRNSLVNGEKCQLTSLAVATLFSDKFDKATVQLDFIFDPTVSNLTVKNIAGNEQTPIGHKCDCLFTCHVSSCPVAPAPFYEFEWNFPDLSQIASKYNRKDKNRDLVQRQQAEVLQQDLALSSQFERGNVVGFPHQYLLNATACKELFLASRDMMRTSQPITVTCRAAGGYAASNRFEVKFYNLLEKSFRDECKTFRRPENAGDGRRD